MNLQINTCINIKSKHYPNIQCKNKTTDKFCSKHIKNPIIFYFNKNNSAKIIQKIWKKYCIKQYYKRQGPAKNNYSISNNTSELYSLENIELIPKIYFFSFFDTNKNVWSFDIRTLSYLLSRSKKVQNPYTRENISNENIEKIKKRIEWLKRRKYPTMYIENNNFTSEQIWNQNVLDIFTKMEEAGYIVNCDWFHNLDKEDHIKFYKKIYDIWNYRIGLTVKQKNTIVPGFNGKNKLFKHLPNEINDREEKYLKKLNLNIIQKLVSSTNDKTQSSLGIMYVLMGLCYVDENVSDAFPWIYASIF
jgi:hypothetical protein